MEKKYDQYDRYVLSIKKVIQTRSITVDKKLMKVVKTVLMERAAEIMETRKDHAMEIRGLWKDSAIPGV